MPAAIVERRGARRGRATSAESPRSSLAPPSEELWALAFLAGFYLGADTVLGSAAHRIVNVAGPVLLCAILGYGAWRMIQAEGTSIWTALFWFRLSTATYFGLGTSVVYFVNTVTHEQIVSYFAFNDEAVLKLNVVVALSACAVLGAARVTLSASPPRVRPRASTDTGGNLNGLLWIGAAFLAVGAVIDYAFVVPYALKWTDYILPGSVLTLTNLVPVGIFMIAVWSLERAWALFPLVAGLVAVRAATSLLLFEKSTLLKTLILFLLAVLWHRFTMRRLLAFAALVAAAYAAVVPIVNHGRLEMSLRYGDHFVAGLDERWQILASYFRDGPHEEPGEQRQSGWARISYVNQATFAISLYDSGWPGDSLALLPAVLVPRVLWPSKPIITRVGTDFNVMATGIETSASSPTLYGEAYWNFGWLGIPLCMIPYGVILAVLSRHTAWVFRERRWIYVPTVFLALIMGLRTDGMFVADVAGAGVILAALLCLLFVAERLGLAMRPRPMARVA